MEHAQREFQKCEGCGYHNEIPEHKQQRLTHRMERSRKALNRRLRPKQLLNTAHPAPNSQPHQESRTLSRADRGNRKRDYADEEKKSTCHYIDDLTAKQ